jgi:hypothetical protein
MHNNPEDSLMTAVMVPTSRPHEQPLYEYLNEMKKNYQAEFLRGGPNSYQNTAF